MSYKWMWKLVLNIFLLVKKMGKYWMFFIPVTVSTSLIIVITGIGNRESIKEQRTNPSSWLFYKETLNKK